MCGETFLGKKPACKGVKGQEKGKQNEAFRVPCWCAEVGEGRVRTTIRPRTESSGLMYCNEILTVCIPAKTKGGGCKYPNVCGR